jgi:hypothetical protein
MSNYAKAICLVGLIWQPVAIARFVYTMNTPIGALLLYIESIFYHAQMALILVIQMQLLKVFTGMGIWVSERICKNLQIFTIFFMVVMLIRNTYEYTVLGYQISTDTRYIIIFYILVLFAFFGVCYEALHFAYLTYILSLLTKQKKSTDSDTKSTQFKLIKQLKYLSAMNVSTTFLSFVGFVVSGLFEPDIAMLIANVCTNGLAVHALCVIFANVMVRKIQLPKPKRAAPKDTLVALPMS